MLKQACRQLGILARQSTLDKPRTVAAVSILPMDRNCNHRNYATGKDLKRFYKNVTISEAGGQFQVNLDQRKLKTPMGKLFTVPTEPLALMVAKEWDSQKEFIKKHSMHLTSLCNTSIDNPTGRTKDTVINSIVEFLATDTICYRLDDPPDLVQLQTTEWDPLLDWLNDRFGVDVQPTMGLGVPHTPEQTLHTFRQHLESYNDWALVGYQQAVDVLKSFIIATALVERTLTVELAVALSRLEQEFQVGYWGNVEWYHDVDRMEARARLAAATLFVHLNSTDSRTSFNKSAVERDIV